MTSSVQLMLEGSHPSGEKVHFDPAGRLVWPVLFLYPEHGQTDLISAFSEDNRSVWLYNLLGWLAGGRANPFDWLDRFRESLEVMFGVEDHPAWDKDGIYTPDSVKVQARVVEPIQCYIYM